MCIPEGTLGDVQEIDADIMLMLFPHLFDGGEESYQLVEARSFSKVDAIACDSEAA